jgi:hypothetical protein
LLRAPPPHPARRSAGSFPAIPTQSCDRNRPSAQWTGAAKSDSTLMTAVAGIGAMCQSRSSAPKVANIRPVSTNIRSPAIPWPPIVVTASAPITDSPQTMISAPIARVTRNFSPNRKVASSNPPSVAQAGWITPPCPSGTSSNPAKLMIEKTGPPNTASKIPRRHPTPLRSLIPVSTDGSITSPNQR